MNYKKIYDYLPYIVLGLVAFFFNFWISNRGVFPIDTFLHYDSSYKILTGEKPVKDFWIIHGIALDYIQSVFFYFLGVNWISYITHSSLFNCIITLIFFKLLKSLNIKFSYSFVITLCFLTLFYPISGVPFIDHHATFFSLISLIVFYFGIINKNNNYFVFIPFLFGLAFFSKPVPSAYLGIIFSVVFFIYFLSEKKLKPFLYLITGTILFLVLLFIFLNLENISIKSFVNQLILYPISIGKQRTDFILDAISNRLFNYKFIFLLLFYLIFLLIYKNNFSKISKERLTFLIIIILFSLTMIIHQILTKNQNFIFFLIPINVSLILYLNNKINLKNKNIINTFFIIFCILLTFKYNERFNDKRKFHDLEYIKLDNAINASGIDESLYPLNWITTTYKNPIDEFKVIKKLIEEIENSNKNILLITNYNFIDSITEKKVFSVVKNFDPVTVPSKENKFTENFKMHFTEQLKKKKINEILFFFPAEENIDEVEKNLREYLVSFCYKYEKVNSTTGRIKINNC